MKMLVRSSAFGIWILLCYTATKRNCGQSIYFLLFPHILFDLPKTTAHSISGKLMSINPMLILGNVRKLEIENETVCKWLCEHIQSFIIVGHLLVILKKYFDISG